MTSAVGPICDLLRLVRPLASEGGQTLADSDLAVDSVARPLIPLTQRVGLISGSNRAVFALRTT